MSLSIDTKSVQTANPRHFTVTVTDKDGGEVSKVTGSDEKPVSIDGRNWSSPLEVRLEKPAAGPLKVTVFNDFKKETTVYAVNLETGEVK